MLLLRQVQRLAGPDAAERITIAPDAEASSTSFSVTAPTPEPMIFSFTWSVESSAAFR